MTKRSRLKKMLSCVFVLSFVVCICWLAGSSFLVVHAAEIEVNPDDNYYHQNNIYDSCNVYFNSDVYPITVHCVNYAFVEKMGGIGTSGTYTATEYDVVIKSAEDYLKVSTCEQTGSGYFYGTVITSIKCKGFSPSSCSVKFTERFGSWADNHLSVNIHPQNAGVHFFGYGVEDTSVKNISLSFLGGYDNGYSDGYDKGVQDGYDTGYDYGYRLGQEAVNAGNNSSNTTTDTTDTTDTTSDDWQTLLGIGAALILLAVIVLGITKATKQLK